VLALACLLVLLMFDLLVAACTDHNCHVLESSTHASARLLNTLLLVILSCSTHGASLLLPLGCSCSLSLLLSFSLSPLSAPQEDDLGELDSRALSLVIVV